MKVRPLLILLLFVVSTGILVWIYFAALRGQRAPHRRQWTETLADLDACCRHKHIKSRQYDHFAETARTEQRPGAEHLFRAMAFSARLQEYNCANAIVRLGGRYTPPEKVTVFRGTTDQNLQRSIDYERRPPDALHTGEIDRALAAGNRYAARVLIWSKAGDVRHRALMARYIATGETGHETGYRICPVCGNIYAAEYCDPFCPQCLTDGREFVRIGERYRHLYGRQRVAHGGGQTCRADRPQPTEPGDGIGEWRRGMAPEDGAGGWSRRMEPEDGAGGRNRK